MRNDHGAALGAAGVRPIRHRLLQRAAEFGLIRPIGTPRHHRFLQSPQRQVSQQVLPIFLRTVNDGVAAAFNPSNLMGGDLRRRICQLTLIQGGRGIEETNGREVDDIAAVREVDDGVVHGNRGFRCRGIGEGVVARPA